MIKLAKRLFAATLIVAPFTASAGPQAVCKGMSESACGESSACTWVGAYTRKDGRSVKAYCRTNHRKASKANAGNDKLTKNVLTLDKLSTTVR